MKTLLAFFAGLLLAGSAGAATTSIAQLPILNIQGTGTVRPNLMLLYDNSGSMTYTFTPDYVDDSVTCRTGSTLAKGTRGCTVGQPPFNSPDFNKQYYNPDTLYTPPVKADGSSYPSMTSDQTSNWTAVPTDGIVVDGNTVGVNGVDLLGNRVATTNLQTGFPDLRWCDSRGRNCVYNATGYTYPNDTTKTSYSYDGNGNIVYSDDYYGTGPYYYRIKTAEYCRDDTLASCQSTASSTFPKAAPVRWCTTADLGVCQSKYVGKDPSNAKATTYTYPRFSNATSTTFVRTNIVDGRVYPRTKNRTDCNADGCTYAQEMTNFANWYAYYKTRNQMMKTAVGQAFRPLTDTYNVGIVALSVAAADGGTTRNPVTLMTPPQQFNSTTRAAWYKALYKMDGNQSTPIRLALNAIGKMYANRAPYTVAAIGQVQQYPCQQNFTFITTDGYWNGDAPNASTGPANNDNTASSARFCTLADGCYDPRDQSPASLADVALYWYNGGSNTGVGSLNEAIDPLDKTGIVPAKDDENTHLHMNTYALGLGVDGIMRYEAAYDTAPDPAGDFYKITHGYTSGCPWNGNGAWTWPDPFVGVNDGGAAYQSRVDDLWHAAINGHGRYFAASDPPAVVKGLSSALSAIQAHVGAASAAATSTPNVTQADNDIYSSTFKTVYWWGEMVARKIDPVKGTVSATQTWSTSDQIGRLVSATGDTRTIFTLDVVNGGKKDFRYAATWPAVEKGWFDNKCGALAQCATLAPDVQATVNQGATIVNWLRGSQQYADGNILRAYARTETIPAGLTATIPIVLGDIASSKPAYLRDPRKAYPDAAYTTYKNAQASRAATVYVAANDGMLHAISAANGSELWAYVPRITMKKLHLQASTSYGSNHQFTTDGAPEIGDVKIDGAFRSVLVAGLNAGGRGYYAVDVTDPANPAPLWELCADASVCSGRNYDADIGLTFGNPQFGTWKDRNAVEHWVVFLTSGYNNVPNTDGVTGGDGKGYLYVVDVKTGEVLNKTGTGNGDTTTPSGLARITAITANPVADPLVTYVYGGDNQGKMYRFDFTAGGTPAVVTMADAGSAHPVTVRPDVTQCSVDSTDASGAVSTSAQVMVAFGTGRLFSLDDVKDTTTQGVYVLKDSGTGIAASDWRTKLAQMSLAKNASGSLSLNGTPVNWTTQAGWYFDLTGKSGERVNVDPKIVTGTLNAVSNIPNSDSNSTCTVGGTSYLYQMDVCSARMLLTETTTTTVNGKVVTTVTPIAGRPLSLTSADVGFVAVQLANGDQKVIATTADGNTQTFSMPPATSHEAQKAGWRRVRD